MTGRPKLQLLVFVLILVAVSAVFLSRRPFLQGGRTVATRQKQATAEENRTATSDMNGSSNLESVQGKHVASFTEELDELQHLLQGNFDRDAVIAKLKQLQMVFSSARDVANELARRIANYDEIVRSLAIVAWQRANPGRHQDILREFARSDSSNIVRIFAIQSLIWGSTPFMQIDDSDPLTEKDSAGWATLLHAIADLAKGSSDDRTTRFVKRWSSLWHDEEYYAEPFRKPSSPLDHETVNSILTAIRLENGMTRKRILLSSLSQNLTASSVTDLIEELVANRDSAAREAVKLLGDAPADVAIPILSKAVYSESAPVVEASVYELGRHMKPEVGTMLVGLYWKQPDPDIRRAILVAVTDSRSGVGHEFLADVFSKETDTTVLTAAVRHAPNLAGASMLKDEIKKLLDHPDSAVRAQARHTLLRLQ